MNQKKDFSFVCKGPTVKYCLNIPQKIDLLLTELKFCSHFSYNIHQQQDRQCTYNVTL